MIELKMPDKMKDRDRLEEWIDTRVRYYEDFIIITDLGAVCDIDAQYSSKRVHLKDVFGFCSIIKEKLFIISYGARLENASDLEYEVFCNYKGLKWFSLCTKPDLHKYLVKYPGLNISYINEEVPL